MKAEYKATITLKIHAEPFRKEDLYSKEEIDNQVKEYLEEFCGDPEIELNSELLIEGESEEEQ